MWDRFAPPTGTNVEAGGGLIVGTEIREGVDGVLVEVGKRGGKVWVDRNAVSEILPRPGGASRCLRGASDEVAQCDSRISDLDPN